MATPVVTVEAILSLGLGIGEKHGHFLDPGHADAAVLAGQGARSAAVLGIGQDRDSWTYPIWQQVRDRAKTARSRTRQAGSTCHRAVTDYVDGFWGSGRVFEVLGLPAILGRTFTEADDRRGGVAGRTIPDR